ncbi:MAG: KamA family radical SAM protein [Bdellovibrio sp.]|nr:KamA family radical SAM protein [Bdellovibrio sp.]
MNKPTLRHKKWAAVSDKDWSSWTWQLQNKIETLADLEEIAKLDPDFSFDPEDVRKTQTDFNFAITPYYFSLMNLKDIECPIRLQCLPSSRENVSLDYELLDFPKEDSMMPVPGLTHRYPDRVMLYTTHHCAMYCRFCTRKRKVSDASTALRGQQIEAALKHIAATKTIREVILSGGDIFSFSDRQLDELLTKVRAIDHVEIVRLGTRNLVTLPFRVTPELVAVLKKHQPLYIHTHFNHPEECSAEAATACKALRKAGCVVNNHTVILKGVNNEQKTLQELNSKLIPMGVQPYYFYHCDLTFGSSHFRTKIEDDLKLIRGLHAEIDWHQEITMSHYMVDTPGGGKVELV